ncbi:PREDICTED: uncharacterized protein LOC107165882 [Diuraphis noxia]|uniref:uncharacterized protein LOC107165882 n=1 Tax=Diuraphis noxia TaxID=143948 RepID=UPI000763978A|nr:PREDICTED: uncharacterized protein LOC107165882 [Diuraphis noxia]
MDGKCVYLFLTIFFINILSVANGREKIYIRDSLKVKPFDDRLGTKQLFEVVVNALTTRYKNRKMLEVSKNRYNFHMAWRGIKNFFWQKILNVFCPSLSRELKALRELKRLLIHDDNGSIKAGLGLTLPFKKSKKEGKQDISEEESDETSDEKLNKNSKKRKKGKKRRESDEDDVDSDSDEEDAKKKKSIKLNLDDLLK